MSLALLDNGAEDISDYCYLMCLCKHPTPLQLRFQVIGQKCSASFDNITASTHPLVLANSSLSAAATKCDFFKEKK